MGPLIFLYLYFGALLGALTWGTTTAGKYDRPDSHVFGALVVHLLTGATTWPFWIVGAACAAICATPVALCIGMTRLWQWGLGAARGKLALMAKEREVRLLEQKQRAEHRRLAILPGDGPFRVPPKRCETCGEVVRIELTSAAIGVSKRQI